MVDLRGGNDATCKEWTWNYLDVGCLWLNRLDGQHRNICASMSVHSMALPVPTPFVGVNTSQHPQPLRYKGFSASLAWRRQWHPTPALLPGKSHGQRRLWCTVRGVAELDTNERLTTHTKDWGLLESRHCGPIAHPAPHVWGLEPSRCSVVICCVNGINGMSS